MLGATVWTQHEAPFALQIPLSSGCGRWVVPCVFTLTATKRLLSAATGAGPNGGCKRYCGDWTSAALLALAHRPLPRHLDWRSRP